MKMEKNENLDMYIMYMKNAIDSLRYELNDTERTFDELVEKISEENRNSIKNVDYFIKRLIADNLYTDEMKDFLDNYMKFYND